MDKIPTFLYGTAWKEERTTALVEQAISVGFRGIDTANQRKHYFEEAVGQGLSNAYAQFGLAREDFFLQTKYTFARGQDHRKPYDENADFATQVNQSFQSSLEHLGTDYIDSYVLHGPYQGDGLTTIDFEVWRAMESLVEQKKVAYLGISNVSPLQLEELIQQSRIKPRFVQNRCFARLGWDKQVRTICNKHQIVYQGFSLLTANQAEILRPSVQALSKKYQKTIPQIIFQFCRQINMLPLTGSSSKEHLIEDLESNQFILNEQELSTIENICFS